MSVRLLASIHSASHVLPICPLPRTVRCLVASVWSMFVHFAFSSTLSRVYAIGFMVRRVCQERF